MATIQYPQTRRGDTVDNYHGTSVEDPPGLRESAMGAMHLSYVLDPDGNVVDITSDREEWRGAEMG